MASCLVANRTALLRRDQLATREQQHVGAAPACERLAQRAAGKHAAEAEGLERVDEHDVEIARQAAMLKGIVEDDQPATKRLDEAARRRHAVAIEHVRHARQLLGQLERLVVQLARLHAIAAAGQADAHAALGDTSAASHSTAGVLPVPPSVRLPTLTTGTCAR